MSLKEVITLLDMASPDAKIGSDEQGLPAQSRPFPRYETPLQYPCKSTHLTTAISYHERGGYVGCLALS